MSEVVWTIAGSDSGGGAGIQADLKAMHSFCVHGCSAITALTAQNSLGVEALNPVTQAVLESQLQALANDLRPQAIKIGMLANVQQIQLVAEHLRYYRDNWSCPPYVVYDPVAIATSGDSLIEEDAQDDIADAIKTHLLPLVDVITPNVHETQMLTGVYLIGPDALREAAKRLQQWGAKSVVIKGGHWDYPQGYCVDYCREGEQEYWLGNATITTPHSHGTGCTLSSVIASCLAKGYPLKDAFILGKAYINAGLKSAQRYGEGIGPVAQTNWPSELADFPQVIEPGSWLGDELDFPCAADFNYAAGFAPCPQQLGLYAVVDSVDWLQLCLEHGVKTVQLRMKDCHGEQLEEAIKQAIALGRAHDAQVFINDHWQLALKHGAYGVHLGQQDLHNANLRAIQDAGLRLGLSTHGFYEMLLAHNYRPSYIALGAIYPTTTKDMTGQIQGLQKLRHFVPLMHAHYPTVAIGGIDLTRIAEVVNTGVGSVAVVRAITEAAHPAQAIAQLQQAIKDGRSEQ
ncbi:Thiamine-phosphate synthase [Pseudoalteromonas sp. THAF3]|uniref:thiamine phosphate synthase n=1 Tax=Pseudoalteromonas sp. THAF3 TaxID=2587843 RepID=UPI0012689589|nr:thiamine phosphate synthase [Pseudoalteromonas sp. THAF3]QFU05869.1 Thiamine-phosphate synthase [Pseudoalteromonas sp. THAF3]